MGSRVVEQVKVSSGATTAVSPPGLITLDVGPTTPPQTLAERLAYASPIITDQLFEMAKRLIDDERARQARLDAKANSLFAAVGLSLTIGLTYGIKDPEKFGIGAPHLLVKAAFAVALIAGLAAAAFALWAQAVKTASPGMNEDAVFHGALLKKTHERPDGDHVAAAVEYKKTLLWHLWTIGTDNRALQTKKAGIILRGQKAFAVFLGALFVVFVTLVYGVK